MADVTGPISTLPGTSHAVPDGMMCDDHARGCEGREYTCTCGYDDERDALIERLRGLIHWAHDTLYEIDPSDYDNADVCKLNNASVEVILGLAVELGEKHGKTDEWWQRYHSERASK